MKHIPGTQLLPSRSLTQWSWSPKARVQAGGAQQLLQGPTAVVEKDWEQTHHPVRFPQKREGVIHRVSYLTS